MRCGVLIQRLADEFGERRHVLRVLDYRQPLGMLVRPHALQSFQHLVAFDRDATRGRVKVGKDVIPHGVRVQHGARASLSHDSYVEQALVRRLATMIAHYPRLFIDGKELFGREFTLVDAARTHREAQRLTLDHGTKVPTRPEQPPTPVETLRHRGQPLCNLTKLIRHGQKMQPNPTSAQVFLRVIESRV